MKYLTRAVFGFLSASIFSWPLSAAETISVPDFSGTWGRNSMDFEQPASGPGPIMNLSRLPNGASDQNALFGDFKSPILKPEAANVVKRLGEISLTGALFPSPANQCWPYQPPYDRSYQAHTQLLQQKDKITIIYERDSQVRHIRMNQSHPAHVTPSWMGDSVGHYEGDTLVVDTIGIKVGRYSMVDRYGTPFSPALHVVERYRLIDGQAAKIAAEHSERVNARPPWVELDPTRQDKGLQVEFTVEDEGVFTTPWKGLVTYRRTTGDWRENLCAENPRQAAGIADVPHADMADF